MFPALTQHSSTLCVCVCVCCVVFFPLGNFGSSLILLQAVFETSPHYFPLLKMNLD